MAQDVWKTQIYLKEEQYKYLQRKAAEKGSMSTVIRELIDEKLIGETKVGDSLFDIGKKKYDSGKKDLSVKHDKYLYG